MQRADLPFHYALADAFTVCDAYHCSMLGPTDPNRYYMWTGWDGNDGKGGGPVIANDELGYGWQTYPERLQAAGISWKIYQDSRRRPRRRPASGAGRRIRTSATTATTRCCTSSTTRTPPRAARCTSGRAPEPTSTAAAASSTSSPPTSQSGTAAERVLDRRPRGLHRASGVAGRATAPGTPPACSTR